MSSSNKKAADRAAMAAAMRAQQAKREARRRILAIGGVALAMILIVGGAIVFSVVKKHHDDKKVEQAVAATGSSKYGVIVGPESAKHHVVIYEDFLCPFCGEFEQASHDDLAKLAEEGKVRVEYRPFDFLSSAGDYSARSAEAFSVVLDKSGPEVAKKFHDLLYQHQPEEKGPFPSNDDILKLAVEAGANEADVKDAITNADGKGAWVEGATQAALDAGVRSTPTILLDGKVFQDGRTMDELSQNLVDKIKG